MGTVIRLTDVSINDDSLGIIPLDGYSLENAAMRIYPTTSLAASQDQEGNYSVQAVGAPVFGDGYLKGTGTTAYLKTNYVRDVTKSFTFCVVAKRDATDGLQFYLGDYRNLPDAGAGIFAGGVYGLRPTLFTQAGGNIFANPPSALQNYATGKWHFACLTVDTINKIASFYVPENNYLWEINFTDSLKLNGTDPIVLGGNLSGASGADAFVAFATVHERVFTAEDVELQYINAKAYCQKHGITVE